MNWKKTKNRSRMNEWIEEKSQKEKEKNQKGLNLDYNDDDELGKKRKKNSLYDEMKKNTAAKNYRRLKYKRKKNPVGIGRFRRGKLHLFLRRCMPVSIGKGRTMEGFFSWKAIWGLNANLIFGGKKAGKKKAEKRKAT